ncbi:hypothetical protein ASPWEDRAFT_70236 [Aspergillus wentii DTO 134E9]|uniref:DUF7730 domain-containing protein n=1 Tax=Aspergillus wentii DTO 134E9 TaxID=1073089 RepID=A0A1L9RI10_ASPWE|nr:uncharacterized protein ASPWEDRAFT_70236 [Aspergillus wentii DTO 134E9]OJJ34570.1 hypothetical protein ASPWEDRAFT_70236 [Aspergillus wentii DTO 134E9]
MKLSDILLYPVILVGGTCIIYVLTPLIVHSRSKRHRRQHGERHTTRPKGLPPRKRALSLPLPELPKKSKQKSYAQNECLLFKLPPEIRRLIYKEILAPEDGSVLHVASSHKRLRSMRCHEWNPRIRDWEHRCWGEVVMDGSTKSFWGYRCSKAGNIMGLLQSCRRIYSEAIDVLYTDNVLNVRQTRTVADLPKAMLPHRFQAIRSLHIDVPVDFAFPNDGFFSLEYSAWPLDVGEFWMEAWQAIAQMSGLQDLRVSFSLTRDVIVIPDTESYINIFRPMAELRVPKYVVEFYWAVDLVDVIKAYEDGLPFSIEIKDPELEIRYDDNAGGLPVFIRNGVWDGFVL